ncbi:MAG: hypothetical protein OHK0022_03430 [Roseiflexaceae bacterium]
MSNAHNLRRRKSWPYAAKKQREATEQVAREHAENLRDTLRRLAVLRSAHPELAAELTEIERDVAVAALAFDDIRRWMEEAAQATQEPKDRGEPT